MTYTVHTGDCRAVMATMDDNSVDAIVTDPPYELGFMSKAWDRSGIAYDPAVWAQALRVLKPGGHLLSFGGSRTYHRMACAVEDAGFEVRDQVLWLYGSGFPKSLNVSKAIDAHLGAVREVVGTRDTFAGNGGTGNNFLTENSRNNCVPITAPATLEATAFDGWGTALKPSHEPAVLARKPLIGTVAANILEHGTGGLNIDGCKIPFASECDKAAAAAAAQRAYQQPERQPFSNRGEINSGFNDGPGSLTPYLATLDAGRWPANLIHDGSEMRVFPDGQSRYFYSAKASRDDRDDGLDGFREATAAERSCRTEGSAGALNPRSGATGKGRNTHPTVKPTALMRYLCRLITPPGGVVLDPFCGSGSTGRAALLEGFDFIGIELLEAHAAIARARIGVIAKRGVQADLFGGAA